MTQTLYAGRAETATVSDLYTLDPATAVATSVGPTGHALTGLAQDPTTGTLYAVSSAQSTLNPSSLLTIDVATGAATLVGVFGGAISDIAFDATGQMYGWTRRSPPGLGTGANSALLSIDKTNAAVTRIGDAGASYFGGAISFHSDGTLYGIIGSQLVTFNLTTGAIASVVGTISGAGGPGAASFDANDLLWWFPSAGGGVSNLKTVTVPGLVVNTIGSPGSNYDGLTWATDRPPPGGTFTKIQFGHGLDVTDEGAGVIRVDAGTTGLAGIRFNTFPQAGGWLYVETGNAAEAPNNWGIELNDTTDAGIHIASAWELLMEAGQAGITMRTATGNIFIGATGASHSIEILGETMTLSCQGINIYTGYGHMALTVNGFVVDTNEFGDLHIDATGVNLSTFVPPGTTAPSPPLPMALRSTGAFRIDAGQSPEGSIQISAVGSFVNTALTMMPEDGQLPGYPRGILFEMPVGGKFVVAHVDYGTVHGDQPIFVIDFSNVSSPTYHIKTGATWVADL
jgi:hypothetical protein